MEVTKNIVKALMKAFPRSGDIKDLHLQEIFNHDIYLNSSEDARSEIKIQSAKYTYDYESEIPFFEEYFPDFDTRSFRGARVLDLGSFSGGRLVRWVELYGFSEGHGIDVETVYAEAGNLFAQTNGVKAKFTTGVGENLPYEDNYFDFVVSFDVFEHVQDVAKVLTEIERVMKPGGDCFTVFPPYFNPLEAHLRLATSLHGLHWLFSGAPLTAAYYEVISERGTEANWYARPAPQLQAWERSHILNGITVKKFRQILKNQMNLQLIHWGQNTVVSFGRASKRPVFKVLASVLRLPSRLPILEEIFLGRICCVIGKQR